MMDQYRQAFREEAAELLAELETALLELERSPADGETVGRIFRALHTVKGSSAMFGFEAVTAFAHEIETVFERVRAGALPATRELIGLTLLARDLLAAMVASPDADAATVERCRQLADSFRELASAPDVSPRHEGAGGPAASVTGRYLIRYRPAGESFRNGANPLLLLDELRELGECRVTAGTDRVPPLAEIDPTLCYLTWEVLLATDRGIDAIREVFIFAGEGEVEIEPLDPPGDGSAPDGCEPEPVSKPAAHGAERESISSIRVAADKLDSLVNLVGELVTVQARLTQTAAGKGDPALTALAEEVERLTGELRNSALDIRMLPIGSTFGRFRRLVHDLAMELGKEVELVTAGAETELDKTVIEMLGDPLVHLIRNCIDHGIEPPHVREMAGKPRQGRIGLAAAHSGDSVVLTVSDDGAGIDREMVRSRGVEMGLVTAATDLSDRDLFALIFAPGFSTAREVTSISGRGVGMDVVKRGVEALRGSITVTSRPGEGSEVAIRLPLTLAIIESLLVRIGPDCYVLPLALVEECLELTRAEAARAHGRHLINVRGEIVPYIRLRDRFGVRGAPPAIEQVVVTEVEGRRTGLVVDHVIGGHQTVIKSLGPVFRETTGVSGATILGDGTVALILDVAGLVAEEELAERAA